MTANIRWRMKMDHQFSRLAINSNPLFLLITGKTLNECSFTKVHANQRTRLVCAMQSTRITSSLLLRRGIKTMIYDCSSLFHTNYQT